MKEKGTVSDSMPILVTRLSLNRQVTLHPSAVPPFTTYKDKKTWRPKPRALSSVNQEEDSEDETSAGNTADWGHGEHSRMTQAQFRTIKTMLRQPLKHKSRYEVQKVNRPIEQICAGGKAS